jgi:hypothetical protein
MVWAMAGADVAARSARVASAWDGVRFVIKVFFLWCRLSLFLSGRRRLSKPSPRRDFRFLHRRQGAGFAQATPLPQLHRGHLDVFVPVLRHKRGQASTTLERLETRPVTSFLSVEAFTMGF